MYCLAMVWSSSNCICVVCVDVRHWHLYRPTLSCTQVSKQAPMENLDHHYWNAESSNSMVVVAIIQDGCADMVPL